MAVAIALPPSVPRYLSNGMKATRLVFKGANTTAHSRYASRSLSIYQSSPSYPTLPAVLPIEGQGERQTHREPRTASERTNRMNVALVQPMNRSASAPPPLVSRRRSSTGTSADSPSALSSSPCLQPFCLASLQTLPIQPSGTTRSKEWIVVVSASGRILRRTNTTRIRNEGKHVEWSGR